MNMIGIDIGGTSLRIGMVDQSGNMTAYEKIRQETVLSGDSVHGLGEFIEGYIDRHGAKGQIEGIALALPGTLSKDKSIVVSLPNVEGFNGKPVKALLEDRFSFPVHLMKDVTALYQYDLVRFGIEEEGVIIACYVGTGIGNAISIDGKLLSGHHGAAGELGHIPIWGAEEMCGCGNKGCAEARAGGRYLAWLHKEHFSDIRIDDLFVERADHPFVREFVDVLASVIATEINILDPEIVILGGGVICMAEFPIDALKQSILRYARKPLPAEKVRFYDSDNTGENGVIGAGIYARRNMQA